MGDPYDLARFVAAQDAGGTYDRAVAELRRGRKQSHWMWFVFPQISGLGQSPTSRRFAISSLEEARAYLAHPVLGLRLAECARILQQAPEHDAARVFGGLDAQILRSSMTLFARAAPAEASFGAVLDTYFGGEPDPATDRIGHGDLSRDRRGGGTAVAKGPPWRKGPPQGREVTAVAEGDRRDGAGRAAAGPGVRQTGGTSHGAGTPAAGRPGGDAGGRGGPGAGSASARRGAWRRRRPASRRTVSGAQIAVVQFDLDQPPGQQLGRREAGRVQDADGERPGLLGELPGHGTEGHGRVGQGGHEILGRRLRALLDAGARASALA